MVTVIVSIRHRQVSAHGSRHLHSHSGTLGGLHCQAHDQRHQN